MALLGESALAMWWDMAADMRAEFEHWHSHEHFPERLALPGFQRASRWAAADGGEGFFILYELHSHGALSSPEYLARLNAPTPWSTRLMPHHRNMVRSQTRVLHSHGAGVARHALTVRLSPREGEAERLQAAFRSLVQELPLRAGLAGAHLLRTDTPPLATTTEQKIRGNADRTADWVFFVCGYELGTIERLGEEELAPAALVGLGAAPAAMASSYSLSMSMARGENVASR
jgi:quinol monooxygenase YgiN